MLLSSMFVWPNAVRLVWRYVLWSLGAKVAYILRDCEPLGIVGSVIMLSVIETEIPDL